MTLSWIIKTFFIKIVDEILLASCITCINFSVGAMQDYEKAEGYFRDAAQIETLGSPDKGFPTVDFPALKNEYLDVLKRLGKNDELQKVQNIFLVMVLLQHCVTFFQELCTLL